MVLLNLKVKTLQHTQYEVQIESTATVIELKKLLSEKSQIQPEQQKLIFMGKVLKDSQTVESFGVKEDSVLHLFVSRDPNSSPSPTQNANANQQQNIPNNTPPNTQTNSEQTSQTPNTPQSLPFPFVQFAMSGGPIPPNMGTQQGNTRNPQQVMFRIPAPFGPNQNQRGGPLPFPLFGMPTQVPNQTADSSQTSNEAPNPNPQNQQAQMLNFQFPPFMVLNGNSNNSPQQQQQQQNQLNNPPTPADLELDQAIVAGNMERIKTLIEQQNANVNRGGLHKACMFGHREVVEYLINKGAKTEIKLGGGETALHISALHGQRDILGYLLDQCKANLYERTNDGKTALMLAVTNNHKNVVEELIKRGASVFDNDCFGNTPLILGVQRGNKELVDLILQAKPFVDARDAKGRTAMHFAAAGGFASIIVVLLQAGGNINASNSMRESPLHFACYHGKKDCVTYLLSKGADCNLISNNGSPMQLARSRGFMDIVNILQQHGANVL